ncbi:MAG: NAD-dependent epimerase/dehydratase family protein [Pseudomonadota bacterium]
MNFFKNKRILITGGAGYLATNVISSLRNLDCYIIRLDKPGISFQQVAGVAQIEDVCANICDSTTWKQILKGVDIVFHFAAQTSVYVAENDPRSDLNINVMPMLNLLETCRQNQYKPIIIFSGTATEVGLTQHIPIDENYPDNPITVYDMHKLMSEKYLKHYINRGVVFGSILRLANVYGPGPRSSSADRGVLNMMVRKALQGEELTIYGDGKFIRDYVYVDDVVFAFLSAASNIDMANGRHFVIGSGDAYTIADAVNLVAERARLKTGKEIKVTHIDPPSNLSPIEERNFVAKTDCFTEATSWRAKVSLKDGIDLMIDVYC